jgi:SCP-2 sterol transfer family
VSSEAGVERTLAAYLTALLDGVDALDPTAGARIRWLAGGSTARIRLDRETVLVRFVDGLLDVRPDHPDTQVDGTGSTDRATVLDLLAGRLEVTQAMLTGRLEVVGAPDAVVAMLQIVEIVLDASARSAELQGLQRDLVGAASQPSARGHHAGRPEVSSSVDAAWYPDDIPPDELALLVRLDLMRDDPHH